MFAHQNIWHFLTMPVCKPSLEAEFYTSSVLALLPDTPIKSKYLSLQLHMSWNTQAPTVSLYGCGHLHVHNFFTPPRNSAYTLSSPPNTGAGTSISILSWNCPGFSNSQPYMDQLFRDGADIIALQEHGLWPFELDKLSSSQHLCTAKSDNRLNESSQLSVGCGGVAIQWKKHLCCTPLSDITSDRICGVSMNLQMGHSLLFVPISQPKAPPKSTKTLSLSLRTVSLSTCLPQLSS